METVGLTIAFLVIGGMGVTIGMYISSQIKCHIRKNIMNNNLKNYENGERKRKK